MKTVVVNSEDKKRLVRTAPKKVTEEDTFEQDWANGISGEEVVKRVHEQIKEWWRSNKDDKKA